MNAKTEQKVPWYYTGIGVTLLLVGLPLIGLIPLWRSPRVSRGTRIIVTAVVVFYAFGAFVFGRGN